MLYVYLNIFNSITFQDNPDDLKCDCEMMNIITMSTMSNMQSDKVMDIERLIGNMDLPHIDTAFYYDAAGMGLSAIKYYLKIVIDPSGPGE